MARKQRISRSGMNEKGFTLIELLMVIAIISILAAYGIPNAMVARKAANEVACAALLKDIVSAEETYKIRNLSGAGTYATLAQLESSKQLLWGTPGTYTRNGYLYANLLSPATTTNWGVSATPMTPLSGDRAMAVTNDGFIRSTAYGVIVAPTTIAAAQALNVFK
jgi:prepilin-type N-terminal cleavage/methylation domain-containing protein